jgi:hypothetical protein
MKNKVAMYLERAKAQRERNFHIDEAVSHMAFERIVIGL